MAAKQMLREVLLLRGRLDAMPHDRTWTKDKPTAGKWWLSLAPDRRSNRFQPVIQCSVFASQFDEPGQLRVRLDDAHYRPLGDACFTGAQWRPVEEKPSDPFAEQPRGNSRDDDLP